MVLLNDKVLALLRVVQRPPPLHTHNSQHRGYPLLFLRVTVCLQVFGEVIAFLDSCALHGDSSRPSPSLFAVRVMPHHVLPATHARYHADAFLRAAAGTAVSSLINPDLKDDGGSNSHNTVR